MSLVSRLWRMLATIVTRVVAGLRWLAKQTYRQRALGVAGNPQNSRLLDLHAITVAAHLAVVAALLLSPPARTLIWAVALTAIPVLTGLAIWRSGRTLVGVLIATQGLFAILAIRWHDFLPYLIALAVAQQASLLTVWIRNGASLAVLGRATAYGALLGVFTGGGTLIVGLFFRSLPLWTAAVLFTIAAILSIRIPPNAPRPPRPPRQGGSRQPAQTPQAPEGYSVYRPSSLDSPRDAAE
jgi:hypothetical protein